MILSPRPFSLLFRVCLLVKYCVHRRSIGPALSSSINDQQDKGVPSPPVDNNHFSFHPTPFHREISCTPLSIDLLGKEFGLNESNCIVDLLGEQFDLNESNCIINPLPSALTATREENLNFAEGELLGGCFSKKISVSP